MGSGFAAPLMKAFRVRWALEEAGMPYLVRTLALGPEQRSPEHLARQPFGQAPAIEADGLGCGTHIAASQMRIAAS